MRAEADRLTGCSRGRAGQWLAAAAALLLMAGCTVFAEDEPEPATIQADTDDSQFPSVGEVPDEAPETMSAEERAAMIEQLEADQAAAASGVYTSEATSSESGVDIETGAAVAPFPAPAPTATPTPTPSASVPSTIVPSSAAPTASSGSQGFVYTTIQTPPPSATVNTSAAPTAAATPIAAAALPAPQPLPPVQPYYGTETTAGGQVTVDYSAIDGYGAGLPYGQTGYYGYAGAGQPVALIYFPHGSAALSSDDRRIIRDVAALQKSRGGVIQIVGHASMRTGNVDPATHDRANYQMSLARANAIADALVREGVSSANVQVAAAGSTEPEYYEFTPTGEAGNRRAEIYLTQ